MEMQGPGGAEKAELKSEVVHELKLGLAKIMAALEQRELSA